MYEKIKKIFSFIIFPLSIIAGFIVGRKSNGARNSNLELVEQQRKHIDELEASINNSEQLVRELENRNNELRKQINTGTSELRYELEQLRLKNSETRRELQERIKQARSNIEHIDIGTAGTVENIDRLIENNNTLRELFDKYRKTVNGVENNINDSDRI